MRDPPLSVALFRALEPAVAPAEFPQALRSARPEKPGQAGSGPEVGCFGCELFYLDELTFVKRANRLDRRGTPLLFPAPLAKSADVRGKPQRMPDRSHQEVRHREHGY